MKLFQLTTTGLGDYWVVANNPTEAENKLVNILNEYNYGYSTCRKVTIIKIIAEHITDQFLTGKRLVI